jgi:hypothetical protein
VFAEARARLGPLLDLLCGPDEGGRGKAAAAAALARGTLLGGLVADMAVSRLLRADQAAAPAAIAGLAALGPPAVCHLLTALPGQKDAAARVRLVDALAAVARTVPPAERVPIFLALDVRMNTDPAAEVRVACERAMDAIHPSNTAGSPAARE